MDIGVDESYILFDFFNRVLGVLNTIFKIIFLSNYKYISGKLN